MRVLWVSHRSGIAGAEISMAEGVDALSDRGHEVHVVLPGEGPLSGRLTSAAGIHICPHNPWLTKELPSPFDRLRWAAHDALRARVEMARLARTIGSQLVISNSLVVWAGALAAKRAGLPHVWFLHEYGEEDHGLRFLFGKRPTFAYMRRRADRFLVSSPALRSHFARMLPEERIRLVHLSVDVPAGITVGPADTSVFRLVLVGERKPSKGQQDAVAAMQLLVASGLDVELDLIGEQGDAAYDRKLRETARAVGNDRIRFVGFREDPYTLVANADAGLMCSRSEALGRVTIEAMKLRKPVVGAAAGATPELVRADWNGLLYEPGDPADLARCIRRLYFDREAAREMGRRGQSWALETFNRNVMGTELEDALAH